jgi:hypothetical protein
MMLAEMNRAKARERLEDLRITLAPNGKKQNVDEIINQYKRDSTDKVLEREGRTYKKTLAKVKQIFGAQ